MTHMFTDVLTPQALIVIWALLREIKFKLVSVTEIWLLEFLPCAYGIIVSFSFKS